MTQDLFIITGANRGFGRAISNVIARNARQPTSIILVGRDKQQLQETADSCHCDNVKTWVVSNVCYESAEMTETTAVAGIRDIVTTLEAVTSAVLINNAGSLGDLSKKVRDYDCSGKELDSYINMNIGSFIVLVSAFLRLGKVYMSEASLQIVNISSLLAVQPFSHWGLYACSKAARDMLLKVVAAEEKSDGKQTDGFQTVRTLSYAPGPLDNEMQAAVLVSLGDKVQKEAYHAMKTNGTLVSMEDSAAKLIELLRKDTFESGAHIDYYDLQETS